MGKKRVVEKSGRRGPAPRGLARRIPSSQAEPLWVEPLRAVADGVEVFPLEEPTQPTAAPALSPPEVSEEPFPRFRVNLPPFVPVRNPPIFPFQFTLFGGGVRPETLGQEGERAMADPLAIVEGDNGRVVKEQGVEDIGDRGPDNNEGPSTSEAAVGTSNAEKEETIPGEGQDVAQQVLRTIRLLGMDLSTNTVSEQRKSELVELRRRVIPGVVDSAKETGQKVERKSMKKTEKKKKSEGGETRAKAEKKRISSRISSQWGFGKKNPQEGGRLDSPLIIDEDDTTEAEVVVTREELQQAREEREKIESEDTEKETLETTVVESESSESQADEEKADQEEEDDFTPEELDQDSGDSEGTASEQEEEEIDAERYEKERRRKGKQPASLKKKKESRPVSQSVVIREYLQVSDDEEDEWLAIESDSDELTSLIGSDDEDTQRREMDRIAILINSSTEGNMRRFEDQRQQKEFQDRERAISKSKMHREVHYPSLDLLSARRNFTVFMSKLCCAWLVNLRTEPVPHLLACEFFTSFEFHTTLDLDVESISFRLFGEELRMSLTEWCIRLGIVTVEDALEAEFRSLEIGLPGKHFDFDIEAAWKLISSTGAGPFKHGKPLAHFIANPSVRLTNNFLAYNLLGQHTCFTRISVNELYFMWCMLRGRGINLGFWLAIQCHQISSHLSRHMSLCHVIGALLFYSFDIIRTPQAPIWNVVSRSEPFDLKCFCRTLMAIMLEDGPRFYRPGEVFPQARRAVARSEAGGDDVESRLVNLEQQQQQLVDEMGRQTKTLEELKEMMKKVLQGMVKPRKGKGSSSREQAEEEAEEEAEEDNQIQEEQEGTPKKKNKKRKQKTASPRPSRRGR